MKLLPRFLPIVCSGLLVGMVPQEGPTGGCSAPPPESGVRTDAAAALPEIPCGIEEPPVGDTSDIRTLSLEPVLEEGDLSWAFDGTVPQESRDYVLALWSELRPALVNAMGPPSHAVTVLVSYNPNQSSAGTYSYTQNKMVLKYLPTLPNDAYFNEIYAHETVHAFQDAALDAGWAWVAWAVEGSAVCVTGLVRERVPARFENPRYPSWQALGNLSSTYDMLSQMGSDVLAGTSSLFSTIDVILSYQAAGGFWWILTASQSAAPAGQWERYDYLVRFFGQLYARGRSFTQDNVLATLDETAGADVDGVQARVWIRNQPITNIAGAPGKHVWATIVGTYGSYLPVFPICYVLRFQPYERTYTGGPAIRINSGTVNLRAWNAAGERIWETAYALRSDYYPYPGWQYVNLPMGDMWNTPGGYLLEVDASAVGAGTSYLAVQNVAGSYRASFAADQGTCVTFYDPSRAALAQPEYVTEDATTLLAGNGGDLVVPSNLGEIPSRIRIGIVTTEEPAWSTRTAPLPFRRVLRLDMPLPVPGGSDGKKRIDQRYGGE